ncbi:hypothetical protein HY636_03905 [Candidatus Woesearchaeota archaeon]|nr:hypothetical protein [Candidatus Woesearchaeota archaeon]
MTHNYYNQYGQQIQYEQDNNRESHFLGSLAVEGALVLGAVLAILQFASKCNIDYFNVGGQNKHQGKHITAPVHSTSSSSTNSVIDTKVEFRLIDTKDTSGLDSVVGK